MATNTLTKDVLNERLVNENKEISELIYAIKEIVGFECKKCGCKTFHPRELKTKSRMCTRANCKTIEGLNANTAFHKIKLPVAIALEIIIALQRDLNEEYKILLKVIPLKQIREYQSSGNKSIKDILKENDSKFSSKLFRSSFSTISTRIKVKYGVIIDPKTIFNFLINVGKQLINPRVVTKNQREEILDRYGVYFALFVGYELKKKENLPAWFNIVRLLYTEGGHKRKPKQILWCIVTNGFVSPRRYFKNVPFYLN